jgi:soluble lytic murein transglycosylase
MRQLFRLWICLLATGPVLAQNETDLGDSRRTEFRVAYELARSGSASSDSDSQALRDYEIYAWLQAARLAGTIAGALPEWSETDDAIMAFLAEYDGLPVAWNLRVAWLESLGSRALWAPFRTHYRQEVADTRLRCRNLSARIALDELNGIAVEILSEWLTPLQLPFECEAVFQWLRDTGPLDLDMTEARVRLLLQNGNAAFARIIARQLPDDRRAPLLAWADLIEYPLTTIEAHIAEPFAEIDDTMLTDGWSRLARDDPDAALNLYPALIATDGIGGTSQYTLALALGLAWDRHPESLEIFASVAEDEIDDYALIWQARAALWAAEWNVAGAAIGKMSVEQRSTAQWRYWAARTSNDRSEQDRLFDALSPNDNYFSAAAAAQRHDRPETHPEALPYDAATITRLAAVPAIRRAVELRHVGLPVSAGREWRHAYNSLDREDREQSIHLATSLEWYDLAIVTATELGVFFDYSLLYPRPWFNEIDAAADEFNVERSLIYAVLRQESLYRADAVSSAGAVGLMQLTRGTANDVARDLEELSAAATDTLHPPTNIRLGTARLASMIERYDGHLVPALAAYNAGPAAVDRWLPDRPTDGDVWLENIPYNETREYVRRVLWHSVVFESLDNEQVNARHWLEEVEHPEPDRD